MNARGGIAMAIAGFLRKQKEDPEMECRTIPTTMWRRRGVLVDVLLAILAPIRIVLAALSRPKPVLHIQMSSGASAYRKGILIRLAHRLGFPCILQVHAGLIGVFYEGLGDYGKKWFRGTLSRARMIFTLTHGWKRYLEALTDVPVMAVSNGVEIPEVVDRSSRNSAAPVRILFLSRLTEAKGVYDLLEAFENLLNEGLPVRLTLAGNTEVEEVQEWVARHNLGDVVDVPGWVAGETKARLFAQADVFALPSHFEGQGIALLEAMSYELPAIGGRTGGIPEVLAEGVAGILVEPRDVEGLTEALRRLVCDPGLRCRLGKAGRKRVEEEYSLEIVCARAKEAYRRVIG